jgi:hypothetical protein
MNSLPNLERKMRRLYHAIVLTGIIACSVCASNAQAQVYNYRSTPYYGQQNRIIVSPQTRIFSNRGIRTQSYRPSYGQTRVYSNGRYYSQPYYSQPLSTYSGYGATTYYSQSNPSYYSYPSSQPTYYGTQGNWNQPSVTYQSGYGTGLYGSPQQASNANAGAIIGGAIGGNRGAQVGAAIGGSIRP